MMYWNTIVIAVCGALLLLLLWQEVKRRNKTWLPARIIATVAAIAGLAALALPLSYTTIMSGNSAAEAVLLTEEYSPDSLKTFLLKTGSLPVYSLVKTPVAERAIYLPDAAFLNNDSNRFNRVHVFGNGLTADELSSIQNIPFFFHPTPAKKAIVSISWNQQLVAGDKLRIQGRFVNKDGNSARMMLVGFGQHLDSCVIPANGSYNFELQTVPKHLDRALYSIVILSGKDTIEKEPVPVDVIAAKPIRVLLLAAYPDFENKFLTNWLAQSGYPVMARTRISKDKFTKDYGNMPGIVMNGITPSWLNQFDVIVADAAELSALPQSELLTLQSAVSQQGIGLIVKLDSGNAGTGFYGKRFPLMPEKSTTPVTLKLQFTSDTIGVPWQLKTVQPLYIRPLPSTQPLVQNEKGQTVVSSRLQGAGIVVATTLNNTYSWQLAGSQGYDALWASLLHKAAKKMEQAEAFTIYPKLPVVNEKAVLQLQTTFPEPPQVLAATGKISMEQNYQLPFLWQGLYWPPTKGWVQVSTSHETTKWLYVFDESDWQNVRAENRKSGTQSQAETVIRQHSQSRGKDRINATEIPKVYFFLLFLFAASFLWFERKYHSG